MLPSASCSKLSLVGPRSTIFHRRARPLFIQRGHQHQLAMISKRSLGMVLTPLIATVDLNRAMCPQTVMRQILRHSGPHPLAWDNRLLTTRLFSAAKKKKAGKQQSKSDSEDVDEIDVDEMGVFVASTNENGPSSEFATSYHAPVMWKECMEALLSTTNSVDSSNDNKCSRSSHGRIFVDGTLGGGGHSQALLQALTVGDVVFGCDVDPDALSAASQRLATYCDINNSTPIFIPVQSNFADLSPELLSKLLLSKLMNAGSTDHAYSHLQQLCEKEHLLRVDGILLDLGVSSYQINTAERGFAFMKDGPLDMRMSGNRLDDDSKQLASSLTAADLCNELDFAELRRIFQEYGDEPRSKAITYSIMERRPLRTTGDLQQAVAAVTPAFAKRRRLGRTATLARIFQALRIAVNREDAALEKGLTEMAPSLLRPGGRLAVLSYHSREDRATKRAMRDGTLSKREADRINNQRDVFGNYIGEPRPFKTVGKPQKASDDEVELNSRARSATLRVAERI